MESVPLTSFSPSPPGSLLYVHKRSQKRRRVGHWPSHPPERSLPRRPTAEGRTLTLTLTVIPPLLYETFFPHLATLDGAKKEMDMQQRAARVVLLLSAQPLVVVVAVARPPTRFNVRKNHN